MTITLTFGLVIIVAVFILTVFSTILPYWTYFVKAGVTYHDRLWRNCTVYPDTLDCSNVSDVQGWFHAVQCLMIVGIVILFSAMVSGCVFHYNVSRRRYCLMSTFSSFFGGVVLATGDIVYAVESRAPFSAGFYLSVLSACLSFLAGALMLASVRAQDYIALSH